MLTLMLLPVPELVRLAVEGGRVVLHPRPDGQHAHGNVHGMKVQRRRVRMRVLLGTEAHAPPPPVYIWRMFMSMSWGGEMGDAGKKPDTMCGEVGEMGAGPAPKCLDGGDCGMRCRRCCCCAAATLRLCCSALRTEASSSSLAAFTWRIMSRSQSALARLYRSSAPRASSLGSCAAPSA